MRSKAHRTRCGVCPHCKINKLTTTSGWCNRCRTDLREQSNRAVLAARRAEPCVDCGLVEPAIMELDHVPERGTKEFGLGSQKQGRNPQKFQAEAAKCDTVCPNCHKRRTLARFGGATVSTAGQNGTPTPVGRGARLSPTSTTTPFYKAECEAELGDCWCGYHDSKPCGWHRG